MNARRDGSNFIPGGRGAAGALVFAVSLGLAACTTPAETLNPAAIATPAPPSQIAISPDTGAGDQMMVANAVARVQVAPIVGATVEAAGPLSARLQMRARERNIALVAPDTPATTHVVKGYFSALAEGREIIVIYVWDVLDPAGNRLHRIQGQERTPGNGPNAWAAVPGATMEAIADRTMEQLSAWLASSRSG